MPSGAARAGVVAGLILVAQVAGPGVPARADDAPADAARADEAGAAPPASPDRRPQRPPSPFTLGLAGTLFIPSAGLDLSWQPHPRLALGLQATTLVVHYDLSLRARLYLAPGERGGGPYLGGNGHLWYSPLILLGVAPAVTGELGWEWRGPAGGLVGVGAGAGAVRVPPGTWSSGNPRRWEWIPLLDVRVAFPI